MRSLGSVIPILRGTGAFDRVYGLLNIESGIQSRSWNNAYLRMKEGFKATVSKFAQDEFGPLYNEIRVNAARARKVVDQRVYTDMDLINKILDTSPSNQYQQRKRHGFAAKMVIRVRWHRELAHGFGAKLLASQLKNKNVPVRKKWLVKDWRDLDQVCRNNARQGWIENYENFESGHNQPPAHPGCRCRVQLGISDPNKIRRIIRPVTQPRFINIDRRARRDMEFDDMRFRIPRVMRNVRVPGVPQIPNTPIVTDALRV